jgi:hypothetical protein
VLIGIAVRGVAVAGVIHQPYYNYQAGEGAELGRCIWGVIGLGMCNRGFHWTRYVYIYIGHHRTLYVSGFEISS